MDDVVALTEQDLKDAAPLGEQIIELLASQRPPTAVAACALALATLTYRTQCGTNTSAKLFTFFYKKLEELAAQT